MLEILPMIQASAMRQALDQAGRHRGADQDEQEQEEGQRRPLDVLLQDGEHAVLALLGVGLWSLR